MQRTKLLGGVVLSVALVVGLYLLNRYWIAPAGRNISDSSEHPLAPDFTLTSLKGGELSLADYKGKVVLLNFWATWCGPCRDEVPDFVKLVESYGDQGFVIMGISMDDGPEPVHDFYEEFKMNYPVVMGNAQVAQLYGGVFGIPISFLIGRDGRIYSQHMGVVPRSVIEAENQRASGPRRTGGTDGISFREYQWRELAPSRSVSATPRPSTPRFPVSTWPA